MSEYGVDVRTKIPRDQYKILYTAAASNHTTVAAIVAELVTRGLTVKPTQKLERKGPTREQLATLRELHGLHRSDQEIADALGVGSKSTIRRWRVAISVPRVRESL